VVTLASQSTLVKATTPSTSHQRRAGPTPASNATFLFQLLPSVPQHDKIPDLKLLIKRLVNIFEPGRITLTLFISSEANDAPVDTESPVEAAQRAFKAALTSTA
jgi:hypothetical protein